MEQVRQSVATVSEPSGHGSTGAMWAVLARRTLNKGTRFEHTTDLPIFYLDPRVQGITNRAHARRIAEQVLGAAIPGSGIRLEVHLVS